MKSRMIKRSDDFVGVDFPRTLGNANVALPVELYVESLDFLVFVGDDGLLVASF